MPRPLSRGAAPPPEGTGRGCRDRLPAATQELCLPSVRVPVAVYMPSPRAAWSGTLENILMHGKNLTRRGRENSPALKHRNGPRTSICSHFNKGWVSLQQTVLHTSEMDMGRETQVGRRGGGLHLTLTGMQGGVRWAGVGARAVGAQGCSHWGRKPGSPCGLQAQARGGGQPCPARRSAACKHASALETLGGGGGEQASQTRVYIQRVRGWLLI